MDNKNTNQVFPKKKSKHAFTLVELIIVITILAILATIGYVSMSNYISSARDSSRVTDIKSIYDAGIVYYTRVGETPSPDSKVDIKSGTGILTYQGYAAKSVFSLIGLTKGGVDPKDQIYYTYTTNSAKRKIQLMGYLEGASTARVISQLNPFDSVYAASMDYSNRFIYMYGDTIGILTDSNKAPIQETTSTGIDLSTTSTGIITYFGGTVFDSGKSTATGTLLINQILSAQNNSLPCSNDTHSGYTVPSVLNTQVALGIKSTSISFGQQNQNLSVTCLNGSFDYPHATESAVYTTCNSGYALSGALCVSNGCVLGTSFTLGSCSL